ncbi:MAG: hypothetical protein JJU27_00975 [Gammaproteobacteria bacterium]|nr:hypothetical protein [Gammaproteobacteria bacterium]
MTNPADDSEISVETFDVGSYAPAQVRPSIQDRQETARLWIAAGLLLLLAILMLATFWALLFGNRDWESLRDPVTNLLGLLVGLVGTVVGFYFGAKSK